MLLFRANYILYSLVGGLVSSLTPYKAKLYPSHTLTQTLTLSYLYPDTRRSHQGRGQVNTGDERAEGGGGGGVRLSTFTKVPALPNTKSRSCKRVPTGFAQFVSHCFP